MLNNIPVFHKARSEVFLITRGMCVCMCVWGVGVGAGLLVEMGLHGFFLYADSGYSFMSPVSNPHE